MTRILCVKCPNCSNKANIVSSKEQTPLLKELYFKCTNDGCNLTFSASMEIYKIHNIPLSINANLKQLELSKKINIKDTLNFLSSKQL